MLLLGLFTPPTFDWEDRDVAARGVSVRQETADLVTRRVRNGIGTRPMPPPDAPRICKRVHNTTESDVGEPLATPSVNGLLAKRT